MSKEKFVIKGLGGAKKLNGEVVISGAKNDALKVMAASALFKDDVVIKNIPETEDIKKLGEILNILGASVKREKNNTVKISSKGVKSTDIDSELARMMRASVVLTGPLLSRYGKVTFPAPGGCVIGARPIDLFLNGYEKMGAKIELKDDKYIITAKDKKLRGAEIFFNIQTVGGTETLMMAAVLAKGKTVLKNCATEPEILNLANYLISCGAKIKGAGTHTMEITGGGLLKAGKKPYFTSPDRIEAGSYLLLGALCADNLLINKCNPLHMDSLINLLKESGVPMKIGKDFVQIYDNAKIKAGEFSSFNVRTHEYPGFPTDLQPMITTFLTQTSGQGIVFETIYEGRFKYIQELLKLGANITVMNPREVMAMGYSKLKSSAEAGASCDGGAECEELEANDIRGGFAVLMAALVAEGNSAVSGIHLIDRGYEKVEERLTKIGADIKRV